MSDTPAGGAVPRPAAPAAHPLADLLERVPEVRSDAPLGSLRVTGCTHDSRAVHPGDLYVALPGEHTHGARFAAQAREAGALAVLTDPAGAGPSSATGLPVLVAPSPRAVLGEVAAWAFGDPARDLMLVGVTGTNGKTTTAFLLEAGLRAAGHRTGLLGTVLTRVDGQALPSVRTTPEAPDLQALFAVMREQGVTAAAMEVSSHALALGRVDGIEFASAGFTNLSQDHLEFHASMEDYFAAKALLFRGGRSRRGVVCVDDPYGARLPGIAEMPVATLSLRGPADWQVGSLSARPDGSTFTLTGPGGRAVPAATRLPGRYNCANAALALALLADLGVDPALAAAGISALPGVPGRMERVDCGQPFLALVDYAHTPAAVASLLSAVRELTPARVIVVLGCGGDRDRAKRPLMGAAATAGADQVILTNDNPRSEDPLAILAEIAAGAPHAVVEPDRRAAISLALDAAAPGDAVVVAGKGHETGQSAHGVVSPFDDREVLRQLLAERQGASA